VGPHEPKLVSMQVSHHICAIATESQNAATATDVDCHCLKRDNFELPDKRV